MNHYETLRLLWIVGRTVATCILLAFILKKAKYPIWAGLIPVYNIICLFYSVFGNLRYIWLMLIPGVNLIMWIIIWVKFIPMLGVEYQGRTSYHTPKLFIWMIFFQLIVLAILAFDATEYKGEFPGPNPFLKKPISAKADETVG